MFDKTLGLFAEIRTPFEICLGHLEFRLQPATLAHGCASEVYLNMDVNIHRLPDVIMSLSKFLVPLAVLTSHPQPADSPEFYVKATGKTACKQEK